MQLIQRLRQTLAGSRLETGLRRLGLGRPLLALYERRLLARGRQRVSAFGFQLEFLARTKAELTRVDMAGHHEPDLVARFLACLRQNDVVYDVGANIGVFSVLAARRLNRLGGGEVFAVEPNPLIADTAARNLALNSVAGVKTRVVATALGDTAGVGWLLTAGDGAEGKDRLTYRTGAGVGVTQVLVRCGDDLVRETRLWPNVIKIDVEGGELAVLGGFSESFGIRDLRDVFVEVHPDLLRSQGASAGDIVAFMREHGFQSAWHAPRGTEIHYHFERTE